MRERIRALAEQAVREDLFPPYTPVSCEGYDANDPMDIARYIRTYLLAQHSLVRKDEMLAGTFRYTGVIPCDHTEHENGVDSEMVIPTDCYHKIGHTHIAKFFRPHSDYNPDASPICFLDWDHYCTNYPFIINQGMQGYVRRIERAKIVHQHDDKKLRYLDALAYTVESIRLYLMQTANEYRMGGRPDLADLLDRVPWNAPQNFKEAFQAYWIAWLFLPDSLGRIDQILFPFYDRDIKNGLLTEETAREMAAEFLIKVFSARPGGGFTDHRSADNTFSLGGYAADGHDGFNKLSEIFAETLAELPIWRPQTGVRITRETDIDRMVYLAKLNRKQSNIVFTSDEQRIPAFEKIGIAYEDAANYTMVGCNEWTIMGRGHTGSQGFFNPLKALERVLQQNDQFLTSLDTFDAFYQAYIHELRIDVQQMMDLADAYFDECCKDINVITSIFEDDCIENATPLTRGGARYNTSNWSCNGFANIIDSLASIKQFVYEKKRFTLLDVSKMLRCNWVGYESQRHEIITTGDFWGNDNWVDEIAARFVRSLELLCEERKPKKGGVFRFGSYTGYNSSNINFGRLTGATPDGRYAGELLVASMDTGRGKERNGLTAYLKSVAKLDNSFLIGPLATNVMIDSALADTDEKMKKLAEVYLAFFRMGGLQLQPTYVSANELEKAQLSPEEYANLRVRVTGFSANFVNLDEGVQEEVIHRAHERELR